MAQCSNMVLHCMDFRLGSAIRNELEKRGMLDDTDIVAIAGAGKTIVSEEPESWHNCALEMIDLSINLHHIGKLIIMNHTDCGAYGGRAAFDSDEAEHEKHVADLKAAAEIIKERQPELTVELVLAHINENKTVTFEEIN